MKKNEFKGDVKELVKFIKKKNVNEQKMKELALKAGIIFLIIGISVLFCSIAMALQEISYWGYLRYGAFLWLFSGLILSGVGIDSLRYYLKKSG